jgi:DinB superfamily
MTNLELFKSEWTFTRGLTLDLLDSLTDPELGETLGPGLGPFWKHFRHVGRLQECYQEALNTKKIRFDYGNKRYRGGCSKNALRAYLRALDRELVQVVERVDWNATIEWDGEMASVFQHWMRMLAHEILHHGQWILYMRLMEKKLPPRWKVWGV